jgi:hypothetical protein
MEVEGDEVASKEANELKGKADEVNEPECDADNRLM